MKGHILAVLKQIEEDYDVKIIFASDAGSRALGFSSEESDYDLRFIYIHKQEWYLSIDQHSDVLEVPNHDGLSITVDPRVDASGWEITKALRLYRKSNPSLLEWLNSKIVYCNEHGMATKLKFIQHKFFSPKPYISHHLNLVKKNFTSFQKNEKIKIKLYLYVLRSIMAAKWIEKHQSLPPIDFKELLRVLPDCMVKEEAQRLLVSKQSGEDYIDKNLIINEFVIDEMDRIEKYAKDLNRKVADPTETLNRIFRETLKEVWE
ncbi:nucleotidyltransferase domain-containing protein [Mesobacillus subterraneus]|uniref:nucleotidyltransferase domain-containing protein n=1 Tax=Mesobacillus subterraneus TaxID=285983 RepID=UPI00203D26B1|nr:nucleotidyltransferase domain-containing protein [Mesobacillus subterraneus]MCM3664996.1 nucleotidyltransferase domain-containing protein [Mesobacillus subterraneus]MCM3682083.1 nucleotidyltransferase domain-containing protein [Mesobacillus subterraneus]